MSFFIAIRTPPPLSSSCLDDKRRNNLVNFLIQNGGRKPSLGDDYNIHAVGINRSLKIHKLVDKATGIQ